MAVVGTNSIGNSLGFNLGEQAVADFQAYQFWLARETSVTRKNRWIWQNLLGKSGWEPNMGPTKRTVRTNMAPLSRQSIANMALHSTQMPMIDQSGIGESIRETKLYWNGFNSKQILWTGDWYNFLANSVEPNRKNIELQQERYSDLFYRTEIFNQSPYVWVVGAGLVQVAPSSIGASGKTRAWLAAQLNACTGPLSLQETVRIAQKMTTYLGVPFAEGSDVPNDNGYAGKYTLLTDAETSLNWSQDPWVLANRPLAMNILNGKFEGGLFGLVQPKMEQLPRRFASTADDPAGVTWEYDPEISQSDPNSYDAGEVLPNPNYANIINSPWQVSYMMGDSKLAYKNVSVNPPPSAWAKAGMNWNGKPNWTVPPVMQALDNAGTTVMVNNDRKLVGYWFSTLALGCEPVNQRFILPIIHKRQEFSAVALSTT